MDIYVGRFKLGRTRITPGAVEGIHPEDVMRSMRRHAQGDWGDCGEDDWAANDAALKEGSRLFSVYLDRAGVRFWIITAGDRTATTILLPSEYYAADVSSESRSCPCLQNVPYLPRR